MSADGRVFGKRGQLLRPGVHRTGHLSVGLYGRGKPKRAGVHQLVALAFIGPRPEGMQVCHNNGDPTDNRVENLRYDTQRANTLDAVRHGTIPTGENCRLSKLTEEQVHYVRAHYKPWCRTNGGGALGRKFGVGYQAICAIARGENWKSLPLQR